MRPRESSRRVQALCEGGGHRGAERTIEQRTRSAYSCIGSRWVAAYLTDATNPPQHTPRHGQRPYPKPPGATTSAHHINVPHQRQALHGKRYRVFTSPRHQSQALHSQGLEVWRRRRLERFHEQSNCLHFCKFVACGDLRTRLHCVGALTVKAEATCLICCFPPRCKD